MLHRMMLPKRNCHSSRSFHHGKQIKGFQQGMVIADTCSRETGHLPMSLIGRREKTRRRGSHERGTKSFFN
jgi:hypothetical protein